jgi:hypothetical protein
MYLNEKQLKFAMKSRLLKEFYFFDLIFSHSARVPLNCGWRTTI